MALFKKKQTKKEQMVEARRKRRQDGGKAGDTLFDPSQVLAIGVFAATALLLIAICFIGQTSAGIPLLPNQTAKTNIVAEFPFAFDSKLRTDRLREERRQRVAPVYRLNLEPYQTFSKQIDTLEIALHSELEPTLKKSTPEDWPHIIDDFNSQFRAENNLILNHEDLTTLLTKSDRSERQRLFGEGLIALREIVREGIFDPSQSDFAALDENNTFFRPIEVQGRRKDDGIQSQEEALRLLRFNLAGLEIDTELAQTIYRIFRRGLSPNLEYDEQLTKAKEEKAAESVQTVTVQVKEGETLLEPGTRISAEHIEKITAYRRNLREKDEIIWGFNIHFLQKAILTLGLLITALIYIKVSVKDLFEQPRKLGLATLIIVLNMLLIRFFQQFGQTEFFGSNPTLIALLPYLAPHALGAIIAAIMLGSSAAILVALIVSALYAMMQGDAVDIFLVAFLSCSVGIYFCRDIRLRAKVVRAGAFSGLTMAISICFIGLFNVLDFATISQQMLIALVVGTFTGIAVIGILPLLENAFKFTTDITLLELTDFNHTLLRKLQIKAPGSYHHSLMVANLSERAALEVGANSLLCRATALFHDVGKMVKPEYFIENQRDGINPHDEKNPSMSALIIKSHIKEGVDLARQEKLPQIFIDIIKQHHGTTLIQYFYHKAAKEKEQQLLPLSTSGGTAGINDETAIDESSFRYDGPKPQFKESAILLLADSIEAASRSLKKVTPQSIQEFVDAIVQSKLDDKQLDECPLTLEEIKTIKASFCFTLLNMLHSRVEYPAQEGGKNKGNKHNKGNTPVPIPEKKTNNEQQADPPKRAAV